MYQYKKIRLPEVEILSVVPTAFRASVWMRARPNELSCPHCCGSLFYNGFVAIVMTDDGPTPACGDCAFKAVERLRNGVMDLEYLYILFDYAVEMEYDSRTGSLKPKEGE